MKCKNFFLLISTFFGLLSSSLSTRQQTVQCVGVRFYYKLIDKYCTIMHTHTHMQFLLLYVDINTQSRIGMSHSVPQMLLFIYDYSFLPYAFHVNHFTAAPCCVFLSVLAVLFLLLLSLTAIHKTKKILTTNRILRRMKHFHLVR